MDRVFVSYKDALLSWAVKFPDGCGQFFKQQSPISIPPIGKLQQTKIEQRLLKAMVNNHQSQSHVNTCPSLPMSSLNSLLEVFSKPTPNSSLAFSDYYENDDALSQSNTIPELVCPVDNPCDELSFFETIGLNDRYVSGYNEYSMIGLDLDVLNGRHPTLVNGPKGYDYELVNIHLHLGPAEHPIEGNTDLKIDATLHAVHFNQEHNLFAVIEHQLHFDTEATLDLKLKCTDICNCCGRNTNDCEIRKIEPRKDMNYCSLKEGEELRRNNFNKVFTKNESWVQWLDIQSNQLTGYITYNGGLTTPPCDQDVTFYINPNPIKVQPFKDCGPLNEALNAVENINGGNARPINPILYGTKIEIV